MRLACRELLFALRTPIEITGVAEGMRLAVPEDLDLIAPVQAHLAEMESGVSPPGGFCPSDGSQHTWIQQRAINAEIP